VAPPKLPNAGSEIDHATRAVTSSEAPAGSTSATVNAWVAGAPLTISSWAEAGVITSVEPGSTVSSPPVDPQPTTRTHETTHANSQRMTPSFAQVARHVESVSVMQPPSRFGAAVFARLSGVCRCGRATDRRTIA
jgi:hypothetical protein